MNEQSKMVGWRFWGRWVLMVIAGLLVGMVIFIAIGITVGEVLDRAPAFVFGLVIGLIFGTTFGVAQWRALRGPLPQSTGWIGATVLGFSAAAIFIFGVMDGSNPDTAIVMKLGHGVALGGLLGVTQFFVLRDKITAAIIWIGISLLAWVIAEVVGLGLSALVGSPLDLMGLFLVGAALPGGGMMWLLNRTHQAVGHTV